MKKRVHPLLVILSVLVAAWLILPTLVIVPISFADRPSFQFLPSGWSLDFYAKFFTDQRWFNSLLNSLQIGLIVALVSTVFGTIAAYFLPKLSARLSRVLSGLFTSPMVIPHIVFAVAVYSVFLSWGLVGNIGGFVVAHTAIAMPFVFITVSASMKNLDERLLRAAASLGAPPMATFVKVTLPLLAPGILTGALFAFVTSFDELIISLYLQSPSLRTLPVQMYTSVTADIDPTIAAASTIVMVITTVAILLPQFFTMRKAKI
ncbi:MAG: ABC transporter permease [Leucobacter sp.]